LRRRRPHNRMSTDLKQLVADVSDHLVGAPRRRILAAIGALVAGRDMLLKENAEQRNGLDWLVSEREHEALNALNRQEEIKDLKADNERLRAALALMTFPYGDAVLSRPV
jgi:hypothetical protein